MLCLRYKHPIDNVWVRNRWMIASHYLKSWFFIDFISVFPLYARQNEMKEKINGVPTSTRGAWLTFDLVVPIVRNNIPINERGI